MENANKLWSNFKGAALFVNFVQSADKAPYLLYTDWSDYRWLEKADENGECVGGTNYPELKPVISSDYWRTIIDYIIILDSTVEFGVSNTTLVFFLKPASLELLLENSDRSSRTKEIRIIELITETFPNVLEMGNDLQRNKEEIIKEGGSELQCHIDNVNYPRQFRELDSDILIQGKHINSYLIIFPNKEFLPKDYSKKEVAGFSILFEALRGNRNLSRSSLVLYYGGGFYEGIHLYNYRISNTRVFVTIAETDKLLILESLLEVVAMDKTKYILNGVSKELLKIGERSLNIQKRMSVAASKNLFKVYRKEFLVSHRSLVTYKLRLDSFIRSLDYQTKTLPSRIYKNLNDHLLWEIYEKEYPAHPHSNIANAVGEYNNSLDKVLNIGNSLIENDRFYTDYLRDLITFESGLANLSLQTKIWIISIPVLLFSFLQVVAAIYGTELRTLLHKIIPHLPV